MQDAHQLRKEIIVTVNMLPLDGLKFLAELMSLLRLKFGLASPQNDQLQDIDNDPLVGLFAGPPELASQSEEIVQTASPTGEATGSTFLMSLVGLGESDETDLSERDEEILAQEIDPIRGWGLKEDNLP